ncbi:PIN domain-containing protein [Rhizobium sp.]
MSGFLLDTNVVSQVYRSDVSVNFMRWLDEQGALDAIYLSVVTVHEMERGIRLLEHKGATAKAHNIRIWLRGLLVGYDSSLLTIDPEIAWLSGELEAVAIAAGHAPGAADAMIAGTAKHHNLTVVTKNLKHFRAFAIPVLTPDQAAG